MGGNVPATCLEMPVLVAKHCVLGWLPVVAGIALIIQLLSAFSPASGSFSLASLAGLAVPPR